MTGYFITGAGTGVGKTFTTCALLHANKHARGFKPIVSGWSEADDSDTAQIISATQENKPEVADVTPWRFAAPLSPHRAAELEGKTIPYDTLVDWSWEQAKGNHLRLIEGVGGAMVPLNNEKTTLDWMKALGMPVIFVTGSYLGSISHTLTALEVLQQAGLTVKALVMNESEASSVQFEEAKAGLGPFIQAIPLRIFQPRVSSWREASAIHALASEL